MYANPIYNYSEIIHIPMCLHIIEYYISNKHMHTKLYMYIDKDQNKLYTWCHINLY